MPIIVRLVKTDGSFGIDLDNLVLYPVSYESLAVHHDVAGSTGGFIQQVGMRSPRFRIQGFLKGSSVIRDVDTLRQLAQAGQIYAYFYLHGQEYMRKKVVFDSFEPSPVPGLPKQAGGARIDYVISLYDDSYKTTQSLIDTSIPVAQAGSLSAPASSPAPAPSASTRVLAIANDIDFRGFPQRGGVCVGFTQGRYWIIYYSNGANNRLHYISSSDGGSMWDAPKTLLSNADLGSPGATALDTRHISCYIDESSNKGIIWYRKADGTEKVRELTFNSNGSITVGAENTGPNIAGTIPSLKCNIIKIGSRYWAAGTGTGTGSKDAVAYWANDTTLSTWNNITLRLGGVGDVAMEKVVVVKLGATRVYYVYSDGQRIFGRNIPDTSVASPAPDPEDSIRTTPIGYSDNTQDGMVFDGVSPEDTRLVVISGNKGANDWEKHSYSGTTWSDDGIWLTGHNLNNTDALKKTRPRLCYDRNGKFWAIWVKGDANTQVWAMQDGGTASKIFTGAGQLTQPNMMRPLAPSNNVILTVWTEGDAAGQDDLYAGMLVTA